MKIPLSELLLMDRVYARFIGKAGFVWTMAMKVWAFLFRSGRRLRHYHLLSRWGEALARLLIPEGRRAVFPRLAEQSFSSWWKKHGKP